MITLHRCVMSLTVLLLVCTSVFALGKQAESDNPGFPFHITLETEDEPIILEGSSELMMTPSSYSIMMGQDDEGRCVIHMLNFKTAPGPGTYDVEDTEEVRTAIICVFETMEPRERLASYSGSFTITEIEKSHITGHFDMMVRGPVSGKEFRLHGHVHSDNIPSDLDFGTSQNPFMRQ
jgi:hypothetical protein